jgi:hypothetical protein
MPDLDEAVTTSGDRLAAASVGVLAVAISVLANVVT